MKISIFSKSIVGYKNKIKNSGSQDFLYYKNYNDSAICAIADGHSGEYFKYSDKGARFACESFIEVMEKYIENKKETEYIEKLLAMRVIQYEIYSTWLKKVNCHYKNNIPRAFKKNYFRYGTTLLGVVIYNGYNIYFKLGDGDFLVKENNYYKKIFRNIYQPKVDTLPDNNSFKKMNYYIDKATARNKENVIVMYSDGYENSFNNFRDMIKDINSVIRIYNKNVFSRSKLELRYETKLNDLSKEKSKDDISIIFVNIL